MSCSLDRPISDSIITQVWEWRDEADGCCDHIGRRFVLEIAIIAAIPVAIIELAVRTVFYVLNALVYCALCPCCCCKVPLLPCKILLDTFETILGLAVMSVFQPIIPVKTD
jgi:hypothetical protein